MIDRKNTGSASKLAKLGRLQAAPEVSMDQSVQRVHPPICRAVPVSPPAERIFSRVPERMLSYMEQALADLAGPNLRVLFCGINPGTLSGDLGLHFARPGNRFWKLLCAGGFTESVLLPAEQHTLPGLGIGITNLVGRVTAAASELSAAELRDGARQLEARVGMLRPRCVAVLGLQAYRTAFLRPAAAIGRQPEPLGSALLWLLPNPSGLQARYQLPQMEEMFTALFVASEAA